VGAGPVVAPGDVDGIEAALRELVARWRAGGLASTQRSSADRHALSRRARAEELLALLEELRGGSS
jgi:hypothetical protein